jgi:preprotein translocase subunit SecA
MFKKLFSIFRSDRGLKKIVEEINKLEPEIQRLSSADLIEESSKLRESVKNGAALDEVLPRAFALVREAAKRTLGQRHFDVQLMGGIVLHRGQIAEMATGEGKTLAATAPAYLNALTGKGVHIVTVNEYLAKRDTVWMGQIYHALGLSVACLVHERALIYDPDFTGKSKLQNPNSKQIPNSNDENSKHEHRESALLDKERDITGGYLVQEEYLRPVSRKEAYLADITYGTNHEFGFDYLRDNLVYSLDQQVQFRVNSCTGQRESAHSFAVIDEVDSILIDEARTPLIIAAPDAESSAYYKTFAGIAGRLQKDTDYFVDEKLKSVDITQEGIDKVEKTLGVQNLFAPENLRLTHYLQESLKAKELFLRDRDYVVKDGEIIIVDQFTGRLMLGRRYSGGLHQAIEAKEGLFVRQESRTFAQISIQNYFRMYKKLAGMTGTAQTSAEEFDKVYALAVVSIPTNRLMIRKNLPDLVFKTAAGKYQAIVNEVKQRREKSQPILIGTVSIEKNEELARHLQRAGIPYEILNAKNHEREGIIIAQAGKAGAVTVATNMAGRGVDIILGGNPPSSLESVKVRDVGGLHVIGTERHESRRIDNQLRGRSGRQGDSGSSQFFLSLEDDLMRIFGGERIQKMMQFLKVPEDQPIESRMVSRAISQAQAKVEGMNFDARKHLLEYDDVLNKQRLAIYKKRQEILDSKVLNVKSDKENAISESKIINLSPVAVNMSLGMLDFLWMSHLENMEALAESVRLRAYGHHDPLVEYRREGHLLFQQLLKDFDEWLEKNKEQLKETPIGADQKADQRGYSISENLRLDQRRSASNFSNKKIGRNDPCPCGSGKKYKKCHGS